MRALYILLLLLLLLPWLPAPGSAAAEPTTEDPPDAGASDTPDNGRIQGSLELLYRDVQQSGSSRKFDEDFDGLSSGARLGSLALSWADEDSRWLDHARLDGYGLGGDPFERIQGRLGSKERYELRVDYSKQDYVYDLYELVPDEDGSAWDSTRRRTDIGLTLHVTRRFDVLLDFQDADRSGGSLFMKDVRQNLFRLDTPLDSRARRYGAGVRFKVAQVNFVIRQSYRDYRRDFDNETSGDLGLEPGGTALLDYRWSQSDRGTSDWTEIKVGSPIGRRANVSLTIYGTLLGHDELVSDVVVRQLGIDSLGNEFGGTCRAGGSPCADDATCDALIPGDVCDVDTGAGRAELEGDVLVVDASASVALATPLSLNLRYRDADHDYSGTALRDLDGDGVPEDVTGDGEPLTRTRYDYSVETVSAVLEYRPSRKVTVRGGYKTYDRELVRNGFGPPGAPGPSGPADALRDTDFHSNDDRFVTFGLVLAPLRWFRFDADYEDGDVEQPFTAPSLFSSERLRARAVIEPRRAMRITAAWRRHDNVNDALDFRQLDAATPAQRWNSTADGESWSLAIDDRPGDRWDYSVRYAEQELDTATDVLVDTAGFASVEDAVATYANRNRQLRARVQYRWNGGWRAFLQAWSTRSEGDNDILGPTFSSSVRIDQEFDNVEAGLFHTFESGIYLGATVRGFDYTDHGADGTRLEGALDYDGRILALRGGVSF